MIAEMYRTDVRPKQNPVGIVVHSMAEFIENGERDWFAPDFIESIGLSAHAFITPSGVVIRTLRDDQMGAHARGHNENTLGIEFLVAGVHTYASFAEAIQEPYLTDVQFEAGAEFVYNWRKAHGLNGRQVMQRHSDLSPGRKIDPGAGFPWESFLEGVEY